MSWLLTKSIHNRHESNAIEHHGKYTGGIFVETIGNVVLVQAARTSRTREHLVQVALSAADARLLVSQLQAAIVEHERLRQVNLKASGGDNE